MKHTRFAAVLLIAGLASLASCKKEKDATPITPTDSTHLDSSQAVVVKTQTDNSQDNSDVKSEGDQVNSDVNDALQNFPDLNSGRVDAEAADSGAGTKQICGCFIESRLAERKIILNFDGQTPCLSPSRTRGGTITVQLIRGRYWADAGAQLRVTMSNYKVTRLSDMKSITFNGEKILTNVRGIRYLAVLAGTDSIVYRERGQGIRATFDNGRVQTYSLARSTSYRYKQRAGALRLHLGATGDTTIGGVANLDTWGTNRSGNAFTSAITQAYSSNVYCGLARPTAGIIAYKANGNSLTLTLGVNQQGDTDTRDCAYGYKVAWQIAGLPAGSAVASY